MLGVAETRMASQLYSTALILKDKVHVQRIFLTQRAINFNLMANNLIQKESDQVKSLVFTESTWNEFAVLTSVLHQILGFLRYYDGNNPFEKSEKFNQRRVDCVKVLAKAAGMVNPIVA